MAAIDKLFQILMTFEGSDLHLKQGQKPKIRVHGHLTEVEDYPVLTEKHLTELLEEIVPEQSYWDRFIKSGDVDFAYAMGNVARFRANYFRQFFGYGAIFRIIPSKILTLETIRAPETFKTFGQLKSGLVLVTGPTGSGKSTTLAAIIDYINTNQKMKIITIEEPVEFVHKSKQSLIVHREVGMDTKSFMSGLQNALKSDPDVILVGEMRDKETIGLALIASEMGILVFGTLHTNSAAKTVDRIIDVFPAKQKSQIRSVLANSLKGVVAQQLLKGADGKGRFAAHEILLYTPGLPGIIRSGDTTKIASLIQTNKKMGMITMDDCLLNLVKEKKVSKASAKLCALDKGRFT